MSQQQEPLDLSELRGSIAVVTGAGNGGIGWGLCTHAAGHLGMHVVVVDLHEKVVDRAAQRLREAYPEVQILGVACDVTKPEHLAACLETIRREMPDRRIGAVFANAGVFFPKTILRSTAQEWKTTFEVNVIGVVNTIHTFVPELVAHDAPSLFTATASVGGLARGDGGGGGYQASKHAVVSLCESLSFELANKAPQVRIQVLCPCMVASALLETTAANAQAEGSSAPPGHISPGVYNALGLAMTTEAHAQQVFDLIEAGKFYLVTENVRPYVDHDHPFGAEALIRERFGNLLEGTLNNADAITIGASGIRSSIMKGPFTIEQARRSRAKSPAE